MKSKLKTLLNCIWMKFLVIFGEIKFVKWFPWIQYDPVDWQIKGSDYEDILDKLQPGDVILRRFDGYVDNYFIDGYYSHAGLYIGNHTIIHAAHPHVQEISVFDFCKCDDICIMRPDNGCVDAIRKAKQYLKNKTPYDFDYESGDNSLYCFEMCAHCYDFLDIPKYEISLLCGLIKRKNTYLGNSFIDSQHFKKVYVSR